MPPRGRPPKPREQRVAEGNPGKRPLPQVVKFPNHYLQLADLEEPPDHLGDTAKAWWREAVPVIYELGILEKVDLPMLEFAATQYQRARQAARVIEKQGVIATGSTGQFKEHPMLETERKAQAAYMRFVEQFAGTPQARIRLGLAALEARSLQEELKAGLGTPDLVEVAEDDVVELTA